MPVRKVFDVDGKRHTSKLRIYKEAVNLSVQRMFCGCQMYKQMQEEENLEIKALNKITQIYYNYFKMATLASTPDYGIAQFYI